MATAPVQTEAVALMSAVLSLKFSHEISQSLHILHREGVIQRCAQAADRTVSLEAEHSLILALRDKSGFKLLIGQAEHYIHSGTDRLVNRRAVEIR